MTKLFLVASGCVTPAGVGLKPLFDSVFNARSMIHNTSKYINDEGFNSKVSAFCNIDESSEFFNSVFLNKKDYNRMDKFISMAVLSFEEAARDINLKSIIDRGLLKKDRIGVLLGCGIGGLQTLENAFNNVHKCIESQSKIKVSPFTIPYGIINMASSIIAMRYDIRGVTIGLSSACASASHSIAIGYNMIKSGLLDAVIVGGTEASVTNTGIAGFDSMRALSSAYNDRPHMASRPFDKSRDGFVISEGAGVLILMNEDLMQKAQIKPKAEICGVGMNSLVSHITDPDQDGEGASMSMLNAIHDARINTEDIGIINMHATSTLIGDEVEAKAIKRTFTKDYKKPILSATKSITGHMLGAIGAIELILLAETLNRKLVPSNLNLDDIDDFAVDMNISKQAREIDTRYALSNSFGFGGTNASIVISKV